VTVGLWLANPHNRFVVSSRRADQLSLEMPGKFSGAVGTYASQKALLGRTDGEKILMGKLGLPVAGVSTQITPPESVARYYHELVLLSGALANLGEDTRILQCSQFREIVSASSTSSAMSHKMTNPISAENVAGMHVSVIAEYMKVAMTLVSDLQRDLRWSNVMRSFCSVEVFAYQQILTAMRLLKSMKVNEAKCLENFRMDSKLVVAELLHLFLQREGIPEAHRFVNEKVIPRAVASGQNLYEVMIDVFDEGGIPEEVWVRLRDSSILPYFIAPEKYIGEAVEIVEREALNKL
jgi:adenylosuccinate lyase